LKIENALIILINSVQNGKERRKTFDGGAKKTHPLIDASTFSQKDKKPKRNK
jgi:hypothetical protein